MTTYSDTQQVSTDKRILQNLPAYYQTNMQYTQVNTETKAFQNHGSWTSLHKTAGEISY